jgi:hypothetical protein
VIRTSLRYLVNVVDRSIEVQAQFSLSLAINAVSIVPQFVSKELQSPTLGYIYATCGRIHN